jgi:hypothetical protein
MLPPRNPSYAPSTPAGTSLESQAPEGWLRSSSQLRSRVLGQEEHAVMLALGLVRAATRTLLALEPKLVRASELLLSLDTPRGAAARVELGKLYDDLNRTIGAAVFEGRPMFDGGSAVFDVDDARRNGEPLTVTLPDLDGVLHGEQGLEDFLSRARLRFEVERMANTLRASVADGKNMLREADRQLSVLLTHFHRQRREPAEPDATRSDLAQTAARLRERVLSAGSAALLAQGELSSRASSLVLSDRPPR